MIKCLLLEDELSAVEIIEGYIQKTPFLELLCTYESGLDVPLEQLERIDVLF
ncbi:MAG: hypothetical protein ACFB0A_14350 [Croceivirga sp.]